VTSFSLAIRLLFSLSIVTELEALLELDAPTEGISFRSKFPMLEPSIEGTSDVEGTDASQIIAVHPTVRLFPHSLKSIILSTLGSGSGSDTHRAIYSKR